MTPLSGDDVQEPGAIVFFCYRLLEFRLFLNSGILSACAEKTKVVLLVPADVSASIPELLPDNVEVHPIKYAHFKGFQATAGLSTKLRDFLQMVFSLTYAHSPDYRRCESEEFQIKGFLEARRDSSLARRFITYTVIALAYLACRWRGLRKLLQVLYRSILNESAHQDIFQRFKPSRLVVGSMGLDADGLMLKEARTNGCSTVVTMQTWDRSVCKGYPPIHPDEVIVWSEIMRDEVHHYLDVPMDRIYVEGAPVMDKFFDRAELIPRDDFFRGLRLDPDKKTIYYPLGSQFWHTETVQSIEMLIEARRSRKIPSDTQIVFRMHPFYLRDPKRREEIDRQFDRFANEPGVFFDRVNTHTLGNVELIAQNDRGFQLNCFCHSDVTIAAVSTCMVEATFCHCPAINMEWGLHDVPGNRFPVKDYHLHHLVRIYEYGAVRRVFSFEELLEQINDVLDSSQVMTEGMQTLIDNEAPINRGTAGQAYAERLLTPPAPLAELG